jgi:hypothetical protein
MSISGKLYDSNSGVRRVILTTSPELHPLSNATGATQNYYCLGFDMKGFQYQIDLQSIPAGVTIDQIQANQVWWVEKRTTLYRLYLYGGIYDPQTRQINSTAVLPPPANSTFNAVTISGLTVSGNTTVSRLNVNGDTTINGNLTVSGYTTLSGAQINLYTTMSGGATVNGNFVVNGGTVLNGSATIGNNLTVNGTSTFATPPSVMGKWQTSNTSALPLTSTQEITQTVSGYSNYLITLNSQCLNGDASVGHNAVVILKENTTSATLISRTAGMNANSYATVSITWLYTASAGTSYTFAGFLNQGGSSAGTATNNITILGFN